jgi:hypothetical protein
MSKVNPVSDVDLESPKLKADVTRWSVCAGTDSVRIVDPKVPSVLARPRPTCFFWENILRRNTMGDGVKEASLDEETGQVVDLYSHITNRRKRERRLVVTKVLQFCIIYLTLIYVSIPATMIIFHAFLPAL